MPGIIGTLLTNGSESVQTLGRARALLRHYDWYVDDELYADENLLCSKTHLGIAETLPAPARQDKLLLWIDGEFYNQNEVVKALKIKAVNASDLLLSAYRDGILARVLARLDGNFTSVLYDEAAGQLHFITDRFGLRPLYLWQEGDRFAWSSEQKGFLGFSAFSPKISSLAVRAFLDIGYLPGNLSWFEGVTLLDASTILTVRLQNRQVTKTRYWSWSDIRTQKIGLEDAAREYANLVRKAVDRCMSDAEKMSISLSGGMDSRSILASMPNLSKVNAFTFGTARCWDIQFSKRVCAVKKTPHQFFLLNNDNWLEGKTAAIWQSDGMVGMTHLHASPFLQSIAQAGKVSLSGGTGALGFKGYIASKYPHQRLTAALARKVYGPYADLIAVEDSFYDAPFADPVFFDSHVRKFTLNGAAYWSALATQRYPLMSNELMEFCFSLPEKYRRLSRLDRKAMLVAYPEYFAEIPWQFTGLPPGRSLLTTFFLQFKIRKIQYALGLLPQYPIGNYADWLREKPAIDFIATILKPKDSVYPDFVDMDFWKTFYLPHLHEKRNRTEKIGRAVTLECWLRGIFGKTPLPHA